MRKVDFATRYAYYVHTMVHAYNAAYHATFSNRRTCIPLVCRAWRALAQPPSNLWSDTLDVEFPARPATATSPREFYITLAESVTAWLQRVHAAPTAVSVTHATGRPDREGAALLLLLRCLNWNVTRLSLQVCVVRVWGGVFTYATTHTPSHTPPPYTHPCLHSNFQQQQWEPCCA